MAYYYIGSTGDRQSRRAVISQDIGQVDGLLPSLAAQGVAPVGDTTLSTRNPPLGYRRAREYTWEASGPPFYLAGELAPVGKQSTELPPRAPARSRDYSFACDLFPPLIGADAVNPGQQSTSLPPVGPARERDYTWTQTFELPVFAEIPYGQQTTDNLPPRRVPRAREYTYTETLFAALIGADAMVPGQQLTVPAAPARARCASYDPGTNTTVWLDLQAQAVIGPGKSTAQTDLPPKAPARQRDYSYSETLFGGLIGQDAMTAGVQSTTLPTPRAPRSVWFDQGTNVTVWLDFAAQQVPPPGQSTADTELPPRGYARSRDYSYTETIFAPLIGADALVTGLQSLALPPARPARAVWFDPGQNFTLDLDLSNVAPPGDSTLSTRIPPNGPPRARDYTQARGFPPELIGQDQLPVGDSTAQTELPPRGAARARDYTWLQTYPLHVYESLPVGDTTAPTELAPRAYQRMREYTFLDETRRQLIGQDAMVVGQPWLDTDNLAPRAYQRARDYTQIVRFDMSSVAALSRPAFHTLSDRALYIHQVTDRALYSHQLTDATIAAHTLSDSG